MAFVVGVFGFGGEGFAFVRVLDGVVRAFAHFFSVGIPAVFDVRPAGAVGVFDARGQGRADFGFAVDSNGAFVVIGLRVRIGLWLRVGLWLRIVTMMVMLVMIVFGNGNAACR